MSKRVPTLDGNNRLFAKFMPTYLAQAAIDLLAPKANPTFTGTVTGVTKTHVGLGNVNNTADSAKPVSTAQQAALDLKQNLSAKGTANGYASLGSNGKVPASELDIHLFQLADVDFGPMPLGGYRWLRYSATGGGWSEAEIDAADIVTGEFVDDRLRETLRTTGKLLDASDDVDDAVETGWYYNVGTSSPANTPDNTNASWAIQVIARSNTSFVQIAHRMSSTANKVFVRSMLNGTMSSWVLIPNVDEADARYVKKNGGAVGQASASGTSGTVTMDLNNGNMFTLTPTGNVTALNITNVPAGGVEVVLFVTQGATPRTIATPSGGVFYGAASPTQVANKRCMFIYRTTNQGATWHCTGQVEV